MAKRRASILMLDRGRLVGQDKQALSYFDGEGRFLVLDGENATVATPVAAVIFDYGGVLTTSIGDSFAAWMRAEGVQPESFQQTLRAWLAGRDVAESPVHQLELGEITTEEFDALLASQIIGVDGRPVDGTDLLGRIFGQVTLDEAMFTLVDDLRAAGVKVGLLSNSWGNTYPRDRIDPAFDHIVISGEVGMRKPDLPIYHLSVQGLGVHASSAVFVDDLVRNIEAARTAGLRAIHHTDARDTRERLEELIPALRAQGGAQ